MTALSNAAVSYNILEGTSTVYPGHTPFGYLFHTPASTTLIDEWELSDEAIDTIVKLKSFLKLQNNWDSYGAVPPQKDITEQAISFVKSINQSGQEIFFTAPGPNGEILIELKKGNKTVEVTFTDDRNIASAFFIGDRCIEETNVFDESKISHWLL